MTSVEIREPGRGTVGMVELPAAVFDVAENVPLMHQVVVAQLAAARQGTHKAKNRGEVRGGGKKPYRQKGTGRARQGSTRAPQFTGGGVVHGPVPRDYSQKTPKKMKQAALRSALSDRARNGRVHVLSEFVAGDTPSTKAARAAIALVSERPRVLAVVARDDEVGWRSLRNLPNVHPIAPDQLNTYDVLVNDDVVFTSATLETFLAGASVVRAAAAVSDATAADATAADVASDEVPSNEADVTEESK